MVQGWKADQLPRFKTTQSARLLTIITSPLKSRSQNLSEASPREEHLSCFWGLDGLQQVFLPPSLLFLSFVKWGHEMLRNNEEKKTTQGGSHKKQTVPVWKRRACVHQTGRKPLWSSPCRRCVLVLGACSTRGWKYSLSYKWSYATAVDGRGAPGFKEPLSTPLLWQPGHGHGVSALAGGGVHHSFNMGLYI